MPWACAEIKNINEGNSISRSAELKTFSAKRLAKVFFLLSLDILTKKWGYLAESVPNLNRFRMEKGFFFFYLLLSPIASWLLPRQMILNPRDQPSGILPVQFQVLLDRLTDCILAGQHGLCLGSAHAQGRGRISFWWRRGLARALEKLTHVGNRQWSAMKSLGQSGTLSRAMRVISASGGKVGHSDDGEGDQVTSLANQLHHLLVTGLGDVSIVDLKKRTRERVKRNADPMRDEAHLEKKISLFDASLVSHATNVDIVHVLETRALFRGNHLHQRRGSLGTSKDESETVSSLVQHTDPGISHSEKEVKVDFSE